MIINPGFSPNIWQGRSGFKVIAIVDHTMDGSLSSTTGWFANPASNVSAHFGIGRDGAITQFVDPHNTAWANGIVKKPDLSVGWLADAVKNNVNPNYLTVSIEHDDGGIVPSPGLTEVQYEASLALHIKLIDEFGISVDRDHIIGHYQIDLVDKKNCPGPNFPWTRLMTDLKNHYAVQNITLPKPFDPNPQKLPVGPGVIAEMVRRGDTAETSEQYMVAAKGEIFGTRSITWGKKFRYLSFDKGNGSWDIRVYQEL